ncbi:dehydrogenase [Gordonia sp. TBRC 11910]|uniref:Dehydrogenase n=1 Tax=Gordonia asplenii TaxID=2725283 RepID=A0A848L0P1_9ACTN|nr:GMC family oxidoreductase N-terminal domain-containing protein [Gordonia asplenii]NMO04464.1 dehydrogenase [Gordonia asplenii]
MTYDIVIVGGGSAGCVLANRLSEDPKRSVLLVEAGPDYRSLQETPGDLAYAAFGPTSHNWNLAAAPDEFGTSAFVPRGKVIGGSSSINYCFALRGRPADHDAWVDAGNEGWGFADVLPFYRAMESYPHGADEWHGRSGPYRMSRADDVDVSGIATAFVDAATALGHKYVDDANAPTDVRGVSASPFSAVDNVRQSTALTYLDPVRDRANLEVRGDTLVDRVEFAGTRAVGVRLATGEIISASEVILTAGAYATPAILMRSGVGPAEHLDSLGITRVLDAPGVGAGLREHPAVYGRWAAHPPTTGMGAAIEVCLNAHSGDPDEPDYDLQIYPSAPIPADALPTVWGPPPADHPTGWDVMVLAACVQPVSRGSVTLASTDPADPPVIELGFYSDARDAELVAAAVRIGRQVAQTSPLREMLVEELLPGARIADDDLADEVRRISGVFHHASGTARMGPATDPAAVVDSECSVHGLEGLSIVDASIFPHIPRVPTNPSVIVVAERAAQKLTARFETAPD